MTPCKGLSSKVPWLAQVAPDVVLCQPFNELMRCYTIRGIDMIGDDPETIGARMLQANAALQQVQGPWTLQSEATHRPLTSARLPVWPRRLLVPWLARQERYRLLTTGPTRAWETWYVVTLTWRPPVGQRRPIQTFRQTADHFLGHLAVVLAEVAPSEDEALLTYLHSTVALEWHPVAPPLAGQALGPYLVNQAWDAGTYPDWDARLGRRHVRVLSITGYPRETTALMMQALERLPVPFRWCTRWSNIAAQDATLKERQKDWHATDKSIIDRTKEHSSGKATTLLNEDAYRKAEDLSHARQDVGAGFYKIGHFSPTIVPWGDTAEQADAGTRQIQQTLESLGFVVTREGDYGSRTPLASWLLQWVAPPHHTAAWLSTLPGNTQDGARKSVQSTLALTHLLPGLRAVWPGPELDTHMQAPPWLWLRTEAGSLARIPHYVGGVGHSMYLGNTGVGKSTFIGYSMLCWLNYPTTQGTVLDVGKSARLVTLLCGGLWIDLSTAQFQPLRDIDQMHEFRWCLEWLLGICERGKVEVSSTTQEYLSERLRQLASLPPAQRTMTALLHLCEAHSNRVEGRVSSGVGSRDASGLSKPNEYRMRRLELHRAIQRALRPFCKGGEWGTIFDGVQPTLLDSHLVTFEHGAMIKTPRLLAAVAQYEFHLTERRLDTRKPMFIVAEEAPLLASMPQYKEVFDSWLLTIRKAGGSLAMVINSLEQAAQLGVGLISQENTPTRWYFPNVEATTPMTAKVYDLFGLTKAEQRLIASAKPFRDVYYVARSLGKRLVQLELSPLLLDMVGRNTDDDHALMDNLLAQHGPDGFAAAWFRHHGHHDAADAAERERDGTQTGTGTVPLASGTHPAVLAAPPPGDLRPSDSGLHGAAGLEPDVARPVATV